MKRRRILILGAAGRDFHNFNLCFRDAPASEVIAFTAAQIPGIGGRTYPAALAGPLYPDGIPILAEAEFDTLCRQRAIDEVILAYSDLTHEQVMHLGSRALAAGADFSLLGPRRTMLAAAVPVIAISAVRTGCGKSAVARWLSRRLRERGKRVAVLRHPMPYGDLLRERVQRFSSLADLDAAQCTIEEREEYEPHIALGNSVYAGVDYAAILRTAEADGAEFIVWDGGNNDFPFIEPDLHIALADALRPRQIATHHPGETVVRMADILIVNKVDAAAAADIELAVNGLRALNGRAPIIKAASPVRLDDIAAVTGRRVLVIEDGPTLTHGGMSFGAGAVAAQAAGATLVDPRASAVPEIRAVFEAYPHIGQVLPAVGYNPSQLAALAATVNASAAELVVSATPIDLARLVRIDKPIVRARYEFAEAGQPSLSSLLDAFLARPAVGGS